MRLLFRVTVGYLGLVVSGLGLGLGYQGTVNVKVYG